VKNGGILLKGKTEVPGENGVLMPSCPSTTNPKFVYCNVTLASIARTQELTS
jgi:hypothetical protein